MGIIRISLAIAVVIYHFDPHLAALPGYAAVELFFMISGYYMAMILATGYKNEYAKTDVKRFYLSRFFRLYPIFITVTLLTIIYSLLLWAYKGDMPDFAWVKVYAAMPWWLTVCAVISNLTMLGQDVLCLFYITEAGGFIPFQYGPNEGPAGTMWLADALIIKQAWSIGTEIWFYLLIPFLYNKKLAVLLSIAALSFLLKYIFEYQLDYVSYFFFPAQLHLFLLGVIAYRVNIQFKSHSMNIAALLFLMFSLFIFEYVKILPYVLLFLFMNQMFLFTKKDKIDRLIGNLSYPIYMVHLLIMDVESKLFNEVLHRNAPLLLVVISVVGAGLLLYYLIERRADQYRLRFKL